MSLTAIVHPKLSHYSERSFVGRARFRVCDCDHRGTRCGALVLVGWNVVQPVTPSMRDVLPSGGFR